MVLVSAEYRPATKDSPASTDISFAYTIHGKLEKHYIYFKAFDIGKKTTLSSLLKQKDIFVATEEMVLEARERYSSYLEIRKKLGKQYLGVGIANKVKDSSWYRTEVYMDSDGIPGRIVIDEEDNINLIYQVRLLHEPKNIVGKISDDDNEELHRYVVAPVYASLRVFHLGIHEYLYVDISLIKEYVYDEDVINKLVLSNKMTRLVNVLRTGAKNSYDDIVLGKVGGMFVLCTGKPGTGKTLTAQVFAESTKTPLYTVQCAQLGISANSIEQKLIEIMKRSQRWGAVLLIDEADVYVRVRDNDLEHNAIVGVFLRILETYTGVLFMTSNQNDIDDAILSRSFSHLKFKSPTYTELVRLWKILGDNYGINFSEEEIIQLVCLGPDLVGRDVKQLSRGVRFLIDNQKIDWSKRTFDDFVFMIMDAVEFRGFQFKKPSNEIILILNQLVLSKSQDYYLKLINDFYLKTNTGYSYSYK